MYSKIFMCLLLTTGYLLGQNHASDDSEEWTSSSKIDAGTRIVGGTNAKECPVSGVVKDDKRKSKKPGDIKIVVGSLKISEGGKFYDVDKIFNHEDYKNTTLENDIAVIKATTYIRYDRPAIDKITLATQEVPTGAECVVSGWGYTDRYGSNRPDNLQKLTVKTISNEQCKIVFSKAIKPTNVCTYVTVNKGICQGDSGGPLVYQDEVVGVVSFNYPCARGAPDGFTRVFPYRKWIKDIVLAN